MNVQNKKALYSLIESSLFGKPFHATVTDWNAIYNEMINQTLVALPVPLLNESILVGDALLAKEWHIRASRQIIIHYKRLTQQNKLISLLEQNGISTVILKGAAAAIYYPYPELRSMGDIDFMVAPQDFDSAYQIMIENGYEIANPEDSVKFHISFTKDNVEYELHRYPPGLPAGAKSKYLKTLFYNAMKRSEEKSAGEYHVPVFPALENGMVLLLHIVNHLSRGLGLRQIIDWMMYVDRHLNDRFWSEEFRPVADAAGLTTLAKTVTKICQRHLGLRTDSITWCQDANDQVCDDLLEYFMEQGNFGRKIGGEKDHGVRLISEVHNPIHFFRMLQRRGRVRWAAVQRHPKLKYIAWLYQILIYIGTVFTRKGTLKTWSKDVMNGSERRKLFDQLAIYKK